MSRVFLTNASTVHVNLFDNPVASKPILYVSAFSQVIFGLATTFGDIVATAWSFKTYPPGLKLYKERYWKRITLLSASPLNKISLPRMLHEPLSFRLFINAALNHGSLEITHPAD